MQITIVHMMKSKLKGHSRDLSLYLKIPLWNYNSFTIIQQHLIIMLEIVQGWRPLWWASLGLFGVQSTLDWPRGLCEFYKVDSLAVATIISHNYQVLLAWWDIRIRRTPPLITHKPNLLHYGHLYPKTPPFPFNVNTMFKKKKKQQMNCPGLTCGINTFKPGFMSKGQWTYGPTYCLSIDTHIRSKVYKDLLISIFNAKRQNQKETTLYTLERMYLSIGNM